MLFEAMLSEVFTSVGNASEESESKFGSLLSPTLTRHFARHNSRPYRSLSQDSQAEEVLMVWPVALSSSSVEDGTESCISVQLGLREDCQGLGSSMTPRVMVVAGGGMDVVSSGKVGEDGIAACSLALSRMLSYKSSSQVSLPLTPQATKPLTIFVASSSSCEETRGSRLNRLASAAFSLASASTTILCARQEVASELELLFSRMAATHLALATCPEVDHLQLLDIHGAFTYLAGNGTRDRGRSKGSKKAFSKASNHQHLFVPAHSQSLDLESLTQWSCSRISKADDNDSSPSYLGGYLSPDLPPWKMPAAHRDACEQAWTLHYQPLMRELSYLLTCVPAAFGGRKPSFDLDSPLQSTTWDSKEYSKTLLQTVAFLEHHKCWNTLSSLLLHAEGISVRIAYQGEVLKGQSGSLEPLALKQMLSGASHNDVSVQSFAPEDSDGRAMVTTSMAQVEGAGFEEDLAMKFEGWAEEWMADPATSSPKRAASPPPPSLPRIQSGDPLVLLGLFSVEILLAFACCVCIVVLAMYRGS